MNIAFLTESRSEWGILLPVIREAVRRKHAVQIWVTGQHFAQKTLAIIEKERPPETELIGLKCEWKPVLPIVDWLVVNGDRRDVLPFVVAAYQNGIGITHLSGGDSQECGLIDEPIRHSITKFAHLHFPITPTSYNRLAMMAEDARLITWAGSPLVDDLVSMPPLRTWTNFRQFYLLLMHMAPEWLEQSKQILDWCKAHDRLVYIVSPNGDAMTKEDERHLVAQKTNSNYLGSLPKREFLEYLYNSACFIGNSSAMFLEAQYLGVPCLHIGQRNLGREEAYPGWNFHADNLNDCIIRNGLCDIPSIKDERNGNYKIILDRNGRMAAHGIGRASKTIMEGIEKIGVPTKDFLAKKWIF